MESQFGSSDTSIYAYQSLDVIPLEYHSKNGSVQSKSSLNTFSTCEKLEDVSDDEDRGEVEGADEFESRNRIVIYIIAISLGFQVFPSLSMRYFFKDELGIQPAQLSIFDSISSSVWLLKPLFGFITDSFAVCGAKRRFYLIFCSLLQAAVWLWLAFVVKSFWTAVFAQVLINMSTGFINVIGEALIVEVSRDKDE